ncbi:MAG: histidinol-phosphate transaminase [Myxococcales bacterium]|nr:histidinol-phosphate transaminase [Myxococcales bacterium]
MAPYSPGRPWRQVARELGLAEADLLQLAANENALGPSARAVAAAANALRDAHLYPDGGFSALRAALAARHGVTPQHIAVGNGSNEIIELLVRTFLGPGQTMVTSWPSFVVYRLAVQAAGREALIAPLRNDRYDLAAMAALVDSRTQLVFIANPNNPTGTYVPRRELAAFLDRIPRQVIVVVDEAYAEFADAPDYPDAIRDFGHHPRLVVLRTFSKIYGLAGLRVGYGIMDPALVHYLDCVRQPYNVNGPGQAAALAALEDETHLRASQRLAREGKAQLTEGLARLGLSVVPSQTNFLVVRLGREASPVVDRLRAAGVLVRDMRGYDMPDTIRVTVGTRAQNMTVLEILGRALDG